MSKFRSSTRNPFARFAVGGAIAWAVLCAAASSAVRAADSGPSAFDSLVEAERSFARHSLEHGMRSAFLEYLAPEGVLFRGGPVNGQQMWKARAATPARLAWAPSFAEISGSGDFGFTTGPWTFAVAADSAPAGFGHFVTVWRREAGRPWRAVLDIGISHDDPRTPLDQVKVARGPDHPRPESLKVRGWDAMGGVRRGNTTVGVGTGGLGIGIGSGGFGVGIATGGGTLSRRDQEWRRTAHEKNRLMSAERSFAFQARTRGWSEAYHAVAARDLRTYREGRAPSLGLESPIEWSAKVERSREWVSRAVEIAPSWDLGYVYGLAIARPRGAKPDTASYVHLWRKDDAGEWRMMLDIENPFPRR